MRISETGLQLIRESEGLRLEAYRDVAGVLTIGYGHTGPDVTEGLVITAERADELLHADARDVERCIDRNVTAELTQNEYDALCDFAFNLGCNALRGSTLLRKLNDGDYDGAAAEFGRWNKARVNGRLVEVAGLTTRRRKEAELFERSVT